MLTIKSINAQGTACHAVALVLSAILLSACSAGPMGQKAVSIHPIDTVAMEEPVLYRTVVGSGGLRMRTGPSLESGVVGVLYRGDAVDVHEARPDGWCRVSNGGFDGWLWGAYLDLPGVYVLVRERGRTYIKLSDSTMIGPDGMLRVYRRFEPPLDKVVVNDVFGTRRVHPVNGGLGVLHEGMDLRAGEGTPVLASSYGKVKAVAYHRSYGNFIDIAHPGGYATRYAHLSEVYVNEGQAVEKGDRIGLSGNTGMTTGPHLHFEFMKDGEPLDPAEYMELETAR